MWCSQIVSGKCKLLSPVISASTSKRNEVSVNTAKIAIQHSWGSPCWTGIQGFLFLRRWDGGGKGAWRWRPFAVLRLLPGLLFGMNYLNLFVSLTGNAAHENCRAELRRPPFPTEIRCWNIHKMSVVSFCPRGEREKKKRETTFSFQNSDSFVSGLNFIFHIDICSPLQSLWLSHYGDGMWRRGLAGTLGTDEESGDLFSPSSWTNLLQRFAAEARIFQAFSIDLWDLI